jgi:ATP-binding cassette subfamily F protein uup
MLEEALADFDGTVLVVSHDRYFLDRICDQVVAFEDTGLFAQTGNYSYYLEKKKDRDAASQAAWASLAKASARKPETLGAPTRRREDAMARPNPTRPRKLTFKEQRELEGMEAAILAAETRVQELEITLNDPEFHSTRSREAHTLIADLESAKVEVTRLYERWQELAAHAPQQ